MKKILFSIALMVAMATSASAFYTSGMSAPTTGKLVTPTHEYEIDTWGANSEVYEFTPRSHTGKTCVVFMLDSGRAMGMQCFDKPVTSKAPGKK